MPKPTHPDSLSTADHRQTRKTEVGVPSPMSTRQRFVQQLPKIELHAHLNSSIRRSTLRELAATKGVDPNNAFILSRWPKTLSEAFDVFRVIHSCVTTLQDVERLAFELGQDLEEDGVVYADIRTTPRAMSLASGTATEVDPLDQYIKAVLRGFSRYTAQDPGPNARKVIFRLLLSIDRAKHSPTQARTIVDLAHRYLNRGVVGIDLSGDPTKGQWSDFEPSLIHARPLGLRITLHAGEVKDRDQEMTYMLDFHPDRFGHCCFVSDDNLKRLKESKIPIELCLTSNLLSNSVAELKDHHFGLHYKPSSGGGGDSTICCISTDDSGVFGSPLSKEYKLMMQTFGLTEMEVFNLAKRTLEATFLAPAATSETKERKGLDQDQEEWNSILAAYDDFYASWNWN
ncbi:uncharacterized protein UHO2_00487 [Ustilago hordei]|uniref:Related to adenosine deaminase n=1 Tax=Ustilago hordei TaxID=120017 RepID=I2FML5_USTHO|nr:uncharacterized protein UHO2_00487 [Ustilago hordei]CCF48158.1 related to adenosine deaminase [Ustilago hordei]SYW82002.1 related to adenosine deaminase [Ustilago hordei]